MSSLHFANRVIFYYSQFNQSNPNPNPYGGGKTTLGFGKEGGGGYLRKEGGGFPKCARNDFGKEGGGGYPKCARNDFGKEGGGGYPKCTRIGLPLLLASLRDGTMRYIFVFGTFTKPLSAFGYI